MPRKYATRDSIAGAYYHLFNRGVNKNLIFNDRSDYRYFIRLLQFYLISHDTDAALVFPRRPPRTDEQNLSTEVGLVAYCLMPNHFHFLVRQDIVGGITHFMKALSSAYVAYFNRKYGRTGHLFEASCQAVLVQNEAYFMHAARYIHANPVSLAASLDAYPYSNYGTLVRRQTSSWMAESDLLAYFHNDIEEYRYFVDSYTNQD